MNVNERYDIDWHNCHEFELATDSDELEQEFYDWVESICTFRVIEYPENIIQIDE
jgi:hypothetical protein